MARKAERELDEEARRVLLENAEMFRTQWGCRGVQYPEPKEATPEAKRPIENVERLTGAEGLKTCPNWYASQPDAHYAARARRWREHGHLDAVAPLTSALVFAIEEIDASVSARERDDDERREKKRNHGGR